MIDVGLIGFGLGGRCFHAPVIHAVRRPAPSRDPATLGRFRHATLPRRRIVRTLDELLAIDSIRSSPFPPPTKHISLSPNAASNPASTS